MVRIISVFTFFFCFSLLNQPCLPYFHTGLYLGSSLDTFPFSSTLFSPRPTGMIMRDFVMIMSFFGSGSLMDLKCFLFFPRPPFFLEESGEGRNVW
jgi:hypothetical protein